MAFEAPFERAPLARLRGLPAALGTSPRRAVGSALGRHAPALKRFVPAPLRVMVWRRLFLALPVSGQTATFARWFRRQAARCDRGGSELYGQLLEAAAADIERRGPCWDVVRSYPDHNILPPAAAGLAFMAAVHQVVLEHPGTPLAAYYPSTGGDPTREGVEVAFLQVIETHAARVRELLHRPVQTNEVARSRVLVGGFLTVAGHTNLPLRILEFGASAGLNLLWDHYRYEVGDLAWGEEGSPLRLVNGFDDGCPPFHLRAQVAERRGCDLSPIDPTSPTGRTQLLSHVWADQTERVEQLQSAFEVAAGVDAHVDTADALPWVHSMLRSPVPGVATVIYDTCMMEYLDPAARAEIHRTIEQAGGSATEESPLAFLHLAPSATPGEENLFLTMWPAGQRRHLATCDPHGRNVHWYDAA